MDNHINNGISFNGYIGKTYRTMINRYVKTKDKHLSDTAITHLSSAMERFHEDTRLEIYRLNPEARHPEERLYLENAQSTTTKIALECRDGNSWSIRYPKANLNESKNGEKTISVTYPRELLEREIWGNRFYTLEILSTILHRLDPKKIDGMFLEGMLTRSHAVKSPQNDQIMIKNFATKIGVANHGTFKTKMEERVRYFEEMSIIRKPFERIMSYFESIKDSYVNKKAI